MTAYESNVLFTINDHLKKILGFDFEMEFGVPNRIQSLWPLFSEMTTNLIWMSLGWLGAFQVGSGGVFFCRIFFFGKLNSQPEPENICAPLKC